MEGKEYHTKQREVILEFLQNSGSRHVSVEEVLEHLKAEGQKVGRTTIYRYMEKLTREGTLRKYFIPFCPKRKAYKRQCNCPKL